tara:strand:- start:1015 stop:1746 length:732 start_codon:yes stop_codon:yes gene_type:complete
MKNKIEFFSKVTGVAEAFPIIQSKDFHTKWMKTCMADYKTKKNTLQPSHIQMCPGIFELYKYGFMVPLWHDTVIKAFSDREDFDYVIPSQYLNELRGGDAVGTHPYEVTKFLPKRHYSKHAVVKMNSPWHIVAPPGVKFLVLPIPYPDTYELEHTMGILDPAVSTELNFQFYLNINQGEIMLKAGTPMMYLVPITEHDYSYEVRDMNDHDKAWLEKREYFMIFGFKFNKQKLKETFTKHFYRR